MLNDPDINRVTLVNFIGKKVLPTVIKRHIFSIYRYSYHEVSTMIMFNFALEEAYINRYYIM